MMLLLFKLYSMFSREKTSRRMKLKTHSTNLLDKAVERYTADYTISCMAVDNT